MEPKVVKRILKKNKKKSDKDKNDIFNFHPDFCYFKDEGSGNNWAYGYNVHGNENYKEIKEILKKMITSIWETSLVKSSKLFLKIFLSD